MIINTNNKYYTFYNIGFTKQLGILPYVSLEADDLAPCLLK